MNAMLQDYEACIGVENKAKLSFVKGIVFAQF